MTDFQRPFHDPQHPAVDGQRPWIEAAPASTEDQWVALATDNSRLLTEARMKLADAETQRLAYAKRVADLARERDEWKALAETQIAANIETLTALATHGGEGATP